MSGVKLFAVLFLRLALLPCEKVRYGARKENGKQAKRSTVFM
jgi:hypothetical protein